MDLGEVNTEDLVDELEMRGHVVVTKDEYDDVVTLISEWKHGGKT